MKKILFSLLLFFFCVTNVYAKDTTISVTNDSGKKGDTVKVEVKLADNPGFGLLGVKVDYDTKYLSYEKGKKKNLDKAFMSDIAEVDGTVTIYALVLSGTIKPNGTIAELTFKIKDNTVSEIPLTVRVTDFGVDENTKLPYKTVDGKITVKNAKVEESKNDETKLETTEKVDTGEDTPSSEEENNGEDKKDEGEVQENNKDTSIDKTNNTSKDTKEEKSKINYFVFIPIAAVVLIGVVVFVIIKVKKNGKEKK